MAKNPQSKKNLTRFTYGRTAFQGWRLCIARKGRTFMCYFSDADYGGGEAALKAAEGALEKVKAILAAGVRNGQLTKKAIAEAERQLKAA